VTAAAAPASRLRWILITAVSAAGEERDAKVHCLLRLEFFLGFGQHRD
jgi:hypothetical protein